MTRRVHGPTLSTESVMPIIERILYRLPAARQVCVGNDGPDIAEPRSASACSVVELSRVKRGPLCIPSTQNMLETYTKILFQPKPQ